MRVILDAREPEDHPWLPYLLAGWAFDRARLETGDLALAAMLEVGVIESELARSRYLGRFVVVVEGGLPDVLAARRQMSEPSVIGTLAAWQRRYNGLFLHGSIKVAAEFSFRFLAGKVAEIERVYQKIKA